MRRGRMTGRRGALVAAAIAALAFSPSPVLAQASSLANTLSGFSTKSDQPISIRSDAIELLDRDQIAICTGNVQVKQGDVTLRTNELRVNYVRSGGDDSAQRRISRLEAIGKVLVTVKDQTLTGDRAVFEMDKDQITVDGDVVLSQGGNVLRGRRLTVDLKSGRSRLESGPSTGRVQGSFVPDKRSGDGQAEQTPQNQQTQQDQGPLRLQQHSQ